MDEFEKPAVPWSNVAEQGLIGALMLDADAFDRIADLQPRAAQFFDRRHGAIFDAIAALHGQRQPVDVVTVFAQLERLGQVERCGGMPYLNALAQCVPSAANIRRYVDVVADHASRREAMAAADKVVELARGPMNADDLVDHAQRLFSSIGRVHKAKGPTRLDALIAARVEHYQGLEAGDVSAGISTGFPKLDEALGGGMKPGRMLVLAAHPSVGKSSLAQALASNAAVAGQPVLMLSAEMPDVEVADRAVSNLGGVALGKLSTGKLDQSDWTAVAEAQHRASNLPLYIDDEGSLTLHSIRAKARLQKQRHGLAVVVIDYLQLLVGDPSAGTRHHAIEGLSRGLKALAKELGVTVILLSQLTRRPGDPEPDLGQLKESQSTGEDADAVLLLHPWCVEPDSSTRVLLKIVKNRSGRRGRLALGFDPTTQRWSPSTGDVARGSAI